MPGSGSGSVGPDQDEPAAQLGDVDDAPQAGEPAGERRQGRGAGGRAGQLGARRQGDVDQLDQPGHQVLGRSVDGVGQGGDHEAVDRVDPGARDVAGVAAGVPDELPVADLAELDADAVPAELRPRTRYGRLLALDQALARRR